MFGGGFNNNINTSFNNQNAGQNPSFSGNNNPNGFQSQSMFGVSNNTPSNNQSLFGTSNPFAPSPNVSVPTMTTATTASTTSHWNRPTTTTSAPGFTNSTFGQSPFITSSSSISSSTFPNSSNINTAPTTASPFGTSSNISLQRTTTPAMGPFGSSSSTSAFGTATSTTVGSIGQAAVPTTSFGFASSSSTTTASAATTNFSSNMASMSTNRNRTFGTTNFSTFGTATTPVGKGPTNPFFGGVGDGGSSTVTTASNPFANNNTTSFGFGGTQMKTESSSSSKSPTFGNIVYTPQHRKSPQPTNETATMADAAAKQEKLAELKAKLEAKKKKMMEMKMRQVQDRMEQDEEEHNPPGGDEDDNDDDEEEKNKGSTIRLNPSATEFVPTNPSKFSFKSSLNDKSAVADSQLSTIRTSVSSIHERIPRKVKNTPIEEETKSTDEESQFRKRLMERNKMRFSSSNEIAIADDDAQERNKLAERNASRFASQQNRSTTSYLPADLVERAKNYHPSQKSSVADSQIQDEEEFNHLSTKSLVGTCLQMCPDEELVRRESEGDIQMLELSHPDIYPKGFTLRDTAVKRFRRSAADFKLDIPELIRPPHILEKVCGYLEEYVMERDRQGIDPRFGQVPNPLDVYQFIWDRTRMIRKDFILQNFIGTGGRCNATAVRCHERIARWHAMMEHQLSHIPDYIKNQSQQNIQELGQTMKTLNLYYDDADGRSILEDDAISTLAIVHGCTHNSVRGSTPVDYDGNTLINSDSDTNVSQRFIGNSSTNGTAEPEMRALYILLTINNDGGMEVLKYAARLSRDRPEIFNSKPVQFALDVYKARKEYNYARFFALLKDPSTPYLYACIMYKYVEAMRKACFKIMARTFGFRKRETNEAVNDEYPLENLVNLLCFEDMEEAKEACKHYNIACGKVSTSEADGIEMIFWRKSEFKEPQDPIKGIIIPLRPKKMNRTIESKLGGATRLAVCRGEASGIGATLDSALFADAAAKRSAQIQQKLEEEILKRQNAIEEKRLADEEKKRSEELKRIEHERIEREKRLFQENQARELAEKQEARQKEELLRIEQQRKEADAKRQEQEHLKAVEDANRKKEEDERIRLLRIEHERLKAEEEAKERKRAEELQRIQAEKERQEQIQREKEEAMRRIQQEERRRQLELERKRREEIERKRLEREAEERRVELEWIRKIELAKKCVCLRRWLARTKLSHCGKYQTRKTIEELDPFSTVALQTAPIIARRSSLPAFPIEKESRSFEDVLYQLGTDMQEKIDISRVFLEVLLAKGIPELIRSTRSNISTKELKNTYLFKLGLIIAVDDISCSTSIELIKLWLDSRFPLNEVRIANHLHTEVRTVTTICNIDDLEAEKCDGLIYLIPPGSKSNSDIDISIPVIPIKLEDSMSGENYDSLLMAACKALFDNVVRDTEIPIIEKISLPRLFSIILTKTMFSLPNEEENIHNLPYHVQRKAFDKLSESLSKYCLDVINFAARAIPGLTSRYKNPATEFSQDSIKIVHYFSADDDLPFSWKNISKMNVNERKIAALFPRYTKEASFKAFLQDLLHNAPSSVHHRCNSLMNAHDLTNCIKAALASFSESFISDEFSVYLPLGDVGNIIDLYLKSIPFQGPKVRHLAVAPVDQDNPLDEEVELQYVSPMKSKQSSPIRSPFTSKRILQENKLNQRKRAKTEDISDDMKQCISFTAMLQQAVMSDSNLTSFIDGDPTLAALMSELDESEIKKNM